MARSKLPIITNLQDVQRKISKGKGDRAYYEMRKDYTRLRDAAAKRLKRAQAAGFFKKGYELPTLGEIDIESSSLQEAKSRLAKEYARLSGALKRDTLRVAELRKESAQRAAAFQNLGFKFVTPDNEIEFGDFMGAMIEAFTKIDADGVKSLMYDSDLIAESYEYITETLNEDERNGKELGELFDMFLDYKRSRGEY